MCYTLSVCCTGQDVPSCTVTSTWHYGRAPSGPDFRTHLAGIAVEGFWLAGAFVVWRPFQVWVGMMLAVYSPVVIPVLLLLR